jgi:hypothetical protein
MRSRSALTTTVVVVGLALGLIVLQVTSDSGRAGVGGGSPTQLQTESVPIKMGDRHYQVPLAALASPPEGGREGMFYVSDGLLLSLSWPSMEGTSSNGIASRNQDGNIRVLTFFSNNRMGEVLRRKFVAHVLEPTPPGVRCSDILTSAECPYLYSSSGGRFAQLPDSGGLIHFERYDRSSRDEMLKSDIYIEMRDGRMSAFLVCNRPTVVRRGHGCTMRFTYQSNWYDVSVDTRRITLSESVLLRSKVEQTMDRFEEAGQLLFNEASNGS